jgi:hypothetical protein
MRGGGYYMAKKILFFVIIISFLNACSSQQNVKEELKEESVTTDYIILVEVETAITEQGLVLEEADLPSENAFIQKLTGVSPKAYFIGGKTLSIYVFSTDDEREKGMEDFEEKTATMELVAYKTYTNKNILVFYTEGNEETNSKLSMAIDDLE